MNPLVIKLFMKIPTCGYDEMEATPKGANAPNFGSKYKPSQSTC
jgi:hypothetical protein